MTFSRSHAGMIGIISLFTAMIAPIASSGSRGYPFPLTDVQLYSYIFLILLAIGFYLVSVRRWFLFRFVWGLLVLIVTYLSIVALSGWLHELEWGVALTQMSWGWIFIIIGVIATLYTLLIRTEEVDPSFSLFSDMIIGFIWTLTLIWLSALIISVSIQRDRDTHTWAILREIFWSWEVMSFSGISQSPAYKQVRWLLFERKNDSIVFGVPTSSGSIVYPEWRFYEEKTIDTAILWGKNIVIGEKNIWVDGVARAHSGTNKLSESIILKTANGISILTEKRTLNYTGSIDIATVVQSEWWENFVWVKKSNSWYSIEKNGKAINGIYSAIDSIGLSKSGYDTLALVRTGSGERIIIKNGTPIENLRKNYVEGSWKTNGSHHIYITNDAGIKRLIYDGVSIGKEFSDIREVFLEKSGNAYAYFARPVGSDEYCLFTRFRWNLCGLTGYMNPRLGADGSTVIYAWLREWIWSIYRNADTVIRDTGYTSSDISGDYVFFDITNPKQYLFLMRMEDGKYQIRKNWKVIPHIWEDVGLDVTFWYDNTVIMSAKDSTWWHIIEL